MKDAPLFRGVVRETQESGDGKPSESIYMDGECAHNVRVDDGHSNKYLVS